MYTVFIQDIQFYSYLFCYLNYKHFLEMRSLLNCYLTGHLILYLHKKIKKLISNVKSFIQVLLVEPLFGED